MVEYWIPKYKYQLVKLLEERYPRDKSFKRKAKKQLHAILFSVRRRDEQKYNEKSRV